MKKNKGLVIAVIYFFILTLVPMNLVSEKVFAANDTEGNGSSVKEYLDYTEGYARLAVQYKDETFLIVTDLETRESKMSGIKDGQEKVVLEGDYLPSFKKILGKTDNKIEFINSNEQTGNIYEYNFDDNTLNTDKNLNINDEIKNQENLSSLWIDSFTKDKNGKYWTKGTSFISDQENANFCSFLSSETGYERKQDSFIDLFFDEYNFFVNSYDNKIITVGYNQNDKLTFNFLQDDNSMKSYNLDISGDRFLTAYSNGNKMYIVTMSGTWQDPTYYFDIFNINDGSIDLEKTIEMDNYPNVSFDVMGNVWILKGRTVSELDNNEFKDYYVVNGLMNAFSIYDENHLIVYGEKGYTIISEGNPVEKDENGISNVEIEPEVTQNGDNASVAFSSDNAVKGANNRINIKTTDKTQNLMFDANQMKATNGTVVLKKDSMNIELPIETIDFTGVAEGDKVKFTSTTSQDNKIIASNMKAINKVFKFSLNVLDKDDKVKSSIHKFDAGVAKITLQLTADDVKELDTSKLAVFYYNEDTEEYEKIEGGVFDKDNLTFTFETPHFSEFIIAESNGDSVNVIEENSEATTPEVKPEATTPEVTKIVDKDQSDEILPQTGSAINLSFFLVIGSIFMLLGIVLINKKRTA
ncbi:MAG: LPXTG cell wall anchor domain-containing protein [Clostridiaceae bacterium]